MRLCDLQGDGPSFEPFEHVALGVPVDHAALLDGSASAMLSGGLVRGSYRVQAPANSQQPAASGHGQAWAGRTVTAPRSSPLAEGGRQQQSEVRAGRLEAARSDTRRVGSVAAAAARPGAQGTWPATSVESAANGIVRSGSGISGEAVEEVQPDVRRAEPVSSDKSGDENISGEFNEGQFAAIAAIQVRPCALVSHDAEQRARSNARSMRHVPCGVLACCLRGAR